jgi:propanol-preferring alcohol dehydrogenase
MIGKDVDGGYAEYIVVPEQNAVPLPEEIPFSHGAVLMCSFATALHALRKARLAEGESVAVCGTGGLGMAAIGLARALGASTVFGIDVNDAKLRAAEKLGAIVIDASRENPIETVLDRTAGNGVDVALELVGKPATAQLAVRILAVQGRAAMVGLANTSTDINMYSDLIGREREIIGVSDHLPEEIEELIGLVKNGQLDIAAAVSRSVPLEEDAINAVFDELDAYSGHSIRTVISLE